MPWREISPCGCRRFCQNVAFSICAHLPHEEPMSETNKLLLDIEALLPPEFRQTWSTLWKTMVEISEERERFVAEIERLRAYEEADIEGGRMLFEAMEEIAQLKETLATKFCTLDGAPCYVGTDDDKHWRCGTVQCGRKGNDWKAKVDAETTRLGRRLTLDELLALAKTHNMTPSEIEAQRQSWAKQERD